MFFLNYKTLTVFEPHHTNGPCSLLTGSGGDVYLVLRCPLRRISEWLDFGVMNLSPLGCQWLSKWWEFTELWSNTFALRLSVRHFLNAVCFVHLFPSGLIQCWSSLYLKMLLKANSVILTLCTFFHLPHHERYPGWYSQPYCRFFIDLPTHLFNE